MRGCARELAPPNSRRWVCILRTDVTMRLSASSAHGSRATVPRTHPAEGSPPLHGRLGPGRRRDDVVGSQVTSPREEGPSEQAELGELLPELGWHRHDAGGAALQVPGRLVGVEIAPALEGAPRGGSDRHQLILEDQQAAGGAVVLGALGDIGERLAHLDEALDHPVERAAIEQLVAALGCLEGAMKEAWLLLAGLAPRLEALGLPAREVLDGIAPHAKLDQMQGHARSLPPRRRHADAPTAS